MHPFFRPFQKPSAAHAWANRRDSEASAGTSDRSGNVTDAEVVTAAASPVPTPTRGGGGAGAPKQPAKLPSDLNGNAPSQPALASYPKRAFGTTWRSFQPAWYRTRPWLEYSAVRDACFCFPCRKYGGGAANGRDVVFTLTGFDNWKTALDRGKGFQRHVSSHNHVHASTLWTQHKTREATGETVDCLLVGKTRLEENRYYVKSVAGAVRFLCVNELGLRGTAEAPRHGEAGDDDIASGLFLKLMAYTLEKDDKLARIVQGICVICCIFIGVIY